jgi:hypothetical protein
MTLAIVLFALAATGGAFLAYLRFNNKPLPMPLGVAHGVAAASGLVALLLAVLNGPATTMARVALGLFVAAALGGLTLFSFQARGKQLPIPLVVVHGSAAVIAFVVLLIAVVNAR